MTARTQAPVPVLSECNHALLHAVLAALPILRSDRHAVIETGRVRTPDGDTLEEYARPLVAEYDRSIALCEVALQKAGLQ
jgi:hypothetical protein